MAAEDLESAGEFRVETECINQIAELNYRLVVPMEFSAKMARRGINLTDMKHLLITSNVIRSGMKNRSALWVLRGTLIDGGSVDLTVTFSFNDLVVELLDLQ